MDTEADPLLDQVVVYVIERKSASISGVQRQFRIGYSRAARLVDTLQDVGLISDPGKDGNRTLLIVDQELALGKISDYYKTKELLSALEYKNIDPDGFKLIENYEQAMLFKQQGNYGEEERFLLPSVNPPSIYTGHYRELFIIWRMVIKMYAKQGKDMDIVSLLKRMISLDEEMLSELCRYWSERHGTVRNREYFIGSSNLKVNDIKHLKNASISCADNEGILLADKYLSEFRSVRAKI